MPLDSKSAGAAYIAGWLRGRYGDVEERGGVAGLRRWRVLREKGGAFDVDVSADALEEERVQLREWLETVAEDATGGAPALPGCYRVTREQGVTKVVQGGRPAPVKTGD